MHCFTLRALHLYDTSYIENKRKLQRFKCLSTFVAPGCHGITRFILMIHWSIESY